MADAVTTTNGMYAYNVMWKLKGYRVPSKGSYICKSVFDLLRLLQTAEGVTKDNVETLIVHQHNKGGKTIEVLCIEAGKTIPIDKPHVKLTNEPPLVVKMGGFNYKAYPAIGIEESLNG